jgi:hypothetical protein
MPKPNIHDFKKELKALLIKYNATISANVGEGSDTHGIYDETVAFYMTDTETRKTIGEFEVEGWGVDQSDL